MNEQNRFPSQEGQPAKSLDSPLSPRQEAYPRTRTEGQRSVIVDEHYLGADVQQFDLRFLYGTYSGADAFTEVYFTTASGNLYCIYREDESYKYFIADARKNFGKGGDSLQGSFLEQADIDRGVLQVGAAFNYGTSGRTSPISRILCVNGYREYENQELVQITGGVVGDLRQQFRSIVMKK